MHSRIRRLHVVLYSVAVFCVVAGAARSAAAQEEFEGWNLEPGVAQAHLVMVARVASISQLTVVEGAKTDVALREYRFQPVERLKGIFQREQLSMTASDLGCPADDASSAPPLKEGEFRLLILAQRSNSPFGPGACVSAAPGTTTFEQRVPLLTGPNDPLVAVIKTLIKVADSRSRRERSALLVEQLANADGLSSVPLLTSLLARADWAATDPRAYTSLARLVQSQQTAVRSAAIAVLRDMLATRIAPNDLRQLDPVADALRAIVGSDEPISRVRWTALEALEHLLALKPNFAWPRELLIAQLTSAPTHTERAVAATALSRIAHPQSVAAVHGALAALPLDEDPAREMVYARAAVRLDSAAAERVLLDRLKRSLSARQSLQSEIEFLGRMRSKESLPILLSAADKPSLAPEDRYRIASALGRLGDDRAVPVLAAWLRHEDYALAAHALSALEQLDSQLASREVRPLLKSESNLHSKLRIARLLARHGVADGYALATEHLADAEHTAAAALVLAALDDPRTAGELAAVVAARPDRRWHTAALAGLAAIGDPAARKQLFDILSDGRHALAADAVTAVGLAADSELLLPLAGLVQSRNKQIAMNSLVALRRFLSGVRSSPRGLAAVNPLDPDDEPGELLQPAAEIPAKTRDAVAEAVAALVLDTYVDADVRYEAWAVSRLLGGQRYVALLTELADQAELEGTQLLIDVQRERRRLNNPIKKT